MKYLLGFILFFIIVLFNFRIIAYDIDFYEKESGNLENKKEILSNLLNYFKDEEEINNNYYSEKEKLHLFDVKKIIDRTIYFSYILSMVFILLMTKFYRNFEKVFIYCGIFAGIFLAIAFFSDFNSLFYLFHVVSFDNNYWMLNEESTLIRLFPEEFFYMAFKKIIFRSFFASFILSCIGFLYLHRENIRKVFKEA